MKKKLIRIEPIALLPTPSGCALFLGDGEKTILIYIDPSLGASINLVLQGEKAPRPLTHDLFNDFVEAFGAKVTRMVIVNAEDDVYFARLFIEGENELTQKKIVELDARPSDCIALCVRANAPMYVLASVWSELKDVSSLLMEMKSSQQGLQSDTGFKLDEDEEGEGA